MKKSTVCAIVIPLIAIVAIAYWVAGTTVITVNSSDGQVETSRPEWLWFVSLAVLGITFFAVLVLAFLPFRRGQRELPVFFRAHIFVPVLFGLWVLIGNLFPFSPDQLTLTMPDFLLGADDWGTGNIYTFSKLADSIGLLAGCIACANLGEGAVPTALGFVKRLRLCRPHLLAATILHVGMMLEGEKLAVDMLFLFVWLIVGFAGIAGLQSLANSIQRCWPRILAWLIACGWLFVSVARFRP